MDDLDKALKEMDKALYYMNVAKSVFVITIAIYATASYFAFYEENFVALGFCLGGAVIYLLLRTGSKFFVLSLESATKVKKMDFHKE